MSVSVCSTTKGALGSDDQGSTENGIVCKASSGTRMRRCLEICPRSGQRTRRASRSAATRTSAAGDSLSRRRSRRSAAALATSARLPRRTTLSRPESRMNASRSRGPTAYSTRVASRRCSVCSSRVRSRVSAPEPYRSAAAPSMSINAAGVPADFASASWTTSCSSCW